jgi:hypothetical protein
MSRWSVRVWFLAALGLLGLTSAGFARAALADLDALAGGQFVPSAAPALLGPVDPAGRNAWNCRPEAAAKSTRAGAAELPEPDGS